MEVEGSNSLRQLNRRSSDRIVVRRIKRIIEKYSEVWRVLHEPIQNSIDAIQNREDINAGLVSVELEVENQTVSVEDNGRGFPNNPDLLLPDGTDKDDQQETMGYQGVGLKSVVYSSELFQLSARTSDEQWGVEIAEAADYLESGGESEAPISDREGRDDRGTTINVQFTGDQVVSAIDQVIKKVTQSETNFQLNWNGVRERNYFLENAENVVDEFEYILEYYLKTQTYVGSVNRLTNCRMKKDEESYAKPVDVEIDINFQSISANSFETEFMQEVCERAQEVDEEISIEVENKFIDFQERVDVIRSENPRAISFDIHDFDISTRGIENNPQLIDQVFVKILTPNYSAETESIEGKYSEYLSLLDIDDDEHFEKMKRIYGGFFEKVLSIYVMIGRMDSHHERIVGNNYGMKVISANGVPTAHELTPRSSNQSFYFNPITFILNIDGKLNEGKKELVNDSLRRKCYKFFRDAFEATLNRLAKEFVRTVPQEPNPPSADLVQKTAISLDEVDITRIPLDENTLIVLFYQLIKGKGVDVPTYGLLSQGVFDGKFVFEDVNITSDNDLLNLEFKVDLGDLVDDFDDPNSAKRFQNSNLLIVWNDNLSSTQQQDWRVVNQEAIPTRHLANDPSPGWINTYLRSRQNIYKPIVVVRDLVDEMDSNDN